MHIKSPFRLLRSKGHNYAGEKDSRCCLPEKGCRNLRVPILLFQKSLKSAYLYPWPCLLYTSVAFDGDKYKEYIEKYGIPYAHKEINKGKISFLRDFPKVSFNDLSYSLIADDLGAAFGFRSCLLYTSGSNSIVRVFSLNQR